MMAMALYGQRQYRPTSGINEALAAVRFKAACLLSRTTDGPLGQYRCGSTN